VVVVFCRVLLESLEFIVVVSCPSEELCHVVNQEWGKSEDVEVL